MDCDTCSFLDTPGLTGKCGVGATLFIAMVDLLLRSRCDVADPCNRAGKDDLQLHDEYDFIVVGAGVAGSVIASRLSENPNINVLLLEAGPEEPTIVQIPSLAFSASDTAVDWNYTTVAQQRACLADGGVCKWPRGKMVSGTSGMTGMLYSRGHKTIYDDWARAGNVGWDYNSVLKYFKRYENNQAVSETDDEYHGREGIMPVQQFSHRPPMADDIVQAGVELGYRKGDLNGANQTGINIAQMMMKDGMRGSTSRIYLRPAANRPNLHVAINSHVTKVDVKFGQAFGVEFVTKDGEEKTIKAIKEVILSAGTIGSAHLLLLSGVGPKEQLEEMGINVHNDLPVGEDLHNHVGTYIGFFTNDTAYAPLNSEVLDEFLNNRTGPMASTGLTQATGFFLSKYATHEIPDLQIFIDGGIANCSLTGKLDECTDGSVGSCGGRYVVFRPTNIMAKSHGALKLKSKDPFDYPLLDPNYFAEQVDIDVLIDGIRLAIKFSETEALQRWGFQVDKAPSEGCESFEWGSDEYWECHITRHTGPENHQAGTCKMGPVSDPTSVVDPQLRVRGVINMRVIDASVFPYVPNGNPLSVIIMTAEKGYDMIKDTWGL